jgi:uncharacterized protein YraI
MHRTSLYKITIVVLFTIFLGLQSIASAQPISANPVNLWTGEYYNSPEIAGVPILTRTDTAIAFNWGIGSPLAAVPADHFGVQWTSTTYFERGSYQFFVLADEKVQLTIDGDIVIDTLDNPQAGETLRYTATMSEGDHTITVLYVEDTGEAYIYVAWNKSLDLSLIDENGTLTYHVESPQLSVRSGPGGGYPILTTASNGDTLNLTARSTDNSWLQVTLADETVGWVNRAFIAVSPIINTLPISDLTSTPTLLYTVNTQQLNLRSGPGTSHNAIDTLLQGEQVSAIGRNADRSWLQVERPDGTIGWVSATYLAISPTTNR